MKTPAIVTKDFLKTRVTIDPANTIGRALAAIYQQQTEEEKAGATTVYKNGVGFTAFDAELGTKCAKQFVETGCLDSWMVAVWRKPAKDGYPKIAKYHRQLNAIALAKFHVK